MDCIFHTTMLARLLKSIALNSSFSLSLSSSPKLRVDTLHHVICSQNID
jgi:hypothetical protein